ncbi:hypothetical protein SAMN06269250_0380 [Spirosoma fluviale]|uniref:Uncharacterized protein n=1 Tax=Spirosoma fluviale TaxID=1597977 RepID=A0A286F5V5_9BACT|nr:hypothetical protein SAMN06269250_0380 [Spirosoma fluviale]
MYYFRYSYRATLRFTTTMATISMRMYYWLVLLSVGAIDVTK